MTDLVVHVMSWYSAVKGSFADAEALYDGLLHIIEGFIATPRVLARTHTLRHWIYTTDPIRGSKKKKKYWVFYKDWLHWTQFLRKVWHHINSVWGKPAAGPILIQFSATRFHPLELVQNEAMRVILGCPRTERIEVLRAELHLPRIM
ncbi:hypothetical protein E2C01_057915 [Portunus trituberculatus]|uniref:Uncharacterized protein n=1 Tax=Portunus trituberculatus TaxID=210409 RepID=A0A5B7GUS8_PORTR|nr:hypothetical protein [Portunus trituberculatus]